jgi:hypothetical protein
MKSNYTIRQCQKKEITLILDRFHYLSKNEVKPFGLFQDEGLVHHSFNFKSGFNVALFHNDEPVGACIFTGFPVPELSYECFGLNRDDQDGLWELSRFVLAPEHQKGEHNLATWFMARAIKQLKQCEPTRAVLSYADGDHHTGVIYAANNFTYYGFSDEKKDFWIKQGDGEFKKHSRGKVKGLEGEWRPRSRKHRFLMVFDKSLICKWKSIKWRKQNDE